LYSNGIICALNSNLFGDDKDSKEKSDKKQEKKNKYTKSTSLNKENSDKESITKEVATQKPLYNQKYNFKYQKDSLQNIDIFINY